jgi:hypothetical protein
VLQRIWKKWFGQSSLLALLSLGKYSEQFGDEHCLTGTIRFLYSLYCFAPLTVDEVLEIVNNEGMSLPPI